MTSKYERFIRRSEEDFRTDKGFAWEGDAWLDQLSGQLVITEIGADPNKGAKYVVPHTSKTKK